MAYAQVATPDSTKQDSVKKFDPNITAFKSLQQEMGSLIAFQIPKLEGMDQQLSKNEKDLQHISELFEYRKNIVLYRDSAMRVLVRVRKFHNQAVDQIHQLHFAWQPYNRDLMSVFTRYGELSALNKSDLSLKEFIFEYRRLYGLMDILLRRLQDTYNESEFLLNSKLE
jgi:hypothetical protein